MRLFIAILFITFLLISSCTKRTQEEIGRNIDTASHKLNRDVDTLVNKLTSADTLLKGVTITKADTSKLADRDFRKKLNNVFDNYTDIKKSLSEDDSADVNKKTADFSKALRNGQTMVSADLNNKWKLWVATAEKISAELGAGKTLKAQRTKFSDLSASILEMVKTFGVYNETIYKVECVKINKYWLTNSLNTDNPYYGRDETNEKSQTCFRVIEALKFE